MVNTTTNGNGLNGTWAMNTTSNGTLADGTVTGSEPLVNDGDAGAKKR
jgi:hypothetical protein